MTGINNAALIRDQLTHVVAELNKAQERSADGAAADLAAIIGRLDPVIERLEYSLSLLDGEQAQPQAGDGQADPLDAARALFDAVFDADLPVEQAIALGNGYVKMAEVEAMRAYLELMEWQLAASGMELRKATGE